jgi:hypothetical protein
MILETLPLDISQIKYRPEIFITEIKETPYEFEFSYNIYDHKFYVNIHEDLTGSSIIEGRKLIYAEDLMNLSPLNFKIIPLDFSGKNNEITYDNLTSEIKLYILFVKDGGSSV